MSGPEVAAFLGWQIDTWHAAVYKSVVVQHVLKPACCLRQQICMLNSIARLGCHILLPHSYNRIHPVSWVWPPSCPLPSVSSTLAQGAKHGFDQVEPSKDRHRWPLKRYCLTTRCTTFVLHLNAPAASSRHRGTFDIYMIFPIWPQHPCYINHIEPATMPFNPFWGRTRFKTR